VRLTELEPQFLKLTDAPVDSGWKCRTDATFEDCDGLEFLCPLCSTTNHGPIGTHRVICWKPHVPAHVTPGPGRWGHTGTGLGDLSLVAGSSSVKLEGGCNWHGHITNGEAVGGY
jgi:hypothetical protein